MGVIKPEIHNNVGNINPNQSLVIAEKCVVIANVPFWILIALAKMFFSRIVINRANVPLKK